MVRSSSVSILVFSVFSVLMDSPAARFVSTSPMTERNTVRTSSMAIIMGMLELPFFSSFGRDVVQVEVGHHDYRDD